MCKTARLSIAFIITIIPVGTRATPPKIDCLDIVAKLEYDSHRASLKNDSQMQKRFGVDYRLFARGEDLSTGEKPDPNFLSDELLSASRQEILGGPRVAGTAIDNYGRPVVLVEYLDLPEVRTGQYDDAGKEQFSDREGIQALIDLHELAWKHGWVLVDAQSKNVFYTRKNAKLIFIPFDTHPRTIAENFGLWDPGYNSIDHFYRFDSAYRPVQWQDFQRDIVAASLKKKKDSPDIEFFRTRYREMGFEVP